MIREHVLNSPSLKQSPYLPNLEGEGDGEVVVGGGENLTTLHGKTTSPSFFCLQHHICNVLFRTHDISLASYNVGYINISPT